MHGFRGRCLDEELDVVGIDESKEFKPLRIAVLTVSDSRSLDDDRSGDLLVERLTTAGHDLADRDIVKDDPATIASRFCAWIDDPKVEVVISTGGTGVTGRDITPEALATVVEKEIPGFGEMFRMISYQKIGTSALQSRAAAGVAKGTYLFALPGSTGACKDGWDEILKNQLDIRHRPCNFAELMPRLREHETG
jgi:molybdenum cofactor biosynthesis protein B